MVFQFFYLDKYNDQFFKMVQELENQRNQVLKPLDINLKTKIDHLDKLFELNSITDFQGKLTEIMDELINNLINILK